MERTSTGNETGNDSISSESREELGGGKQDRTMSWRFLELGEGGTGRAGMKEGGVETGGEGRMRPLPKSHGDVRIVLSSDGVKEVPATGLTLRNQDDCDAINYQEMVHLEEGDGSPCPQGALQVPEWASGSIQHSGKR